MAKIYFTITGTNYRHGSDFLEPNMRVRLVKEPDNKYDTEAIKVEIEGLGKIGYVANSTSTRIGENWSAGRMYDKIDDVSYGTVKYVLRRACFSSADRLADGLEWLYRKGFLKKVPESEALPRTESYPEKQTLARKNQIAISPGRFSEKDTLQHVLFLNRTNMLSCSR